MLNILNKKLINNKKIFNSLNTLYGINKFNSKKICKNIGINPKVNIKKINNYKLIKLKNFINNNFNIEYKLKFQKKKFIDSLLEIKNIRGIRNYFGYPSRGQRTHSNAKTSKKFKSIEKINYKNVKKKN